MATAVHMPKLGMYVEDIMLVEWLVAEGETVAAGQSLFELESDKTTSEVEAETGGILHHLAAAGAKVPIGTVVGLIAATEEEYHAICSEVAATAPASTRAPEIAAGGLTPPADPTAQLGVSARIPLRGTRGAIARRMMESLAGTAQLTSVLEVDATGILATRARLAVQAGRPIGVSAVFVSLLAEVLHEHPGLNARIVSDEIELLEEVHIAVGIETDEGVVAPVVRHPERLTVAEIDAQIKQLASRARSGELSSEELRGATFTLSNGGIHPVDITTAVLVPPQVAILWLGRIKQRPVCMEDAVVAHPTVHLCLTYDHRAVDGGPATAFLGALAAAAERLQTEEESCQ